MPTKPQLVKAMATRSIFSFDERNIHSIETNNLIIQTFIKYGQFEKYKKTLYNKKIGGINTRYDQIRDEFKELFFTEMKKDYVKIFGNNILKIYFSFTYIKIYKFNKISTKLPEKQNRKKPAYLQFSYVLSI